MKDGLMWFCDYCNHALYMKLISLSMTLKKIFTGFFKKFYNDESLRTCSNSGEVMPTDVRFAG